MKRNTRGRARKAIRAELPVRRCASEETLLEQQRSNPAAGPVEGVLLPSALAAVTQDNLLSVQVAVLNGII